MNKTNKYKLNKWISGVKLMKVSRNNRILMKLNYGLQQCDGEEDVHEKEIYTEFLYITN